MSTSTQNDINKILEKWDLLEHELTPNSLAVLPDDLKAAMQEAFYLGAHLASMDSEVRKEASDFMDAMHNKRN